MRGLSELVSASLLAAIALILGGLVVAHILSLLQEEQQRLQEESLRQLMLAREALASPLAYYDTNTGNLIVVVVAGDFPVTLRAVYVNDTLAQGCTVRDSTGAAAALDGYVVKPYTLAVIECPQPQASLYHVKIVYEGGELYVQASPA